MKNDLVYSKKPPDYMIHYRNFIMLIKSNQYNQEDILIFLQAFIKEYLLSINNTIPINRKLISSLKQLLSNESIPDLLNILVNRSLSADKRFESFWNTMLSKISLKFWLPNMFNLHISNKKKIIDSFNSWSIIIPKSSNSKQMSLLSQLFSLQNNPPEKDQRYARKIRFYPNPKQKDVLKKQFGLSRYYYNKTINVLNKNSLNRYNIMKHLSKSGCIYQKDIGGETCSAKLESNYFCKKHIKKTFKYKHSKSKIQMRNCILKDEAEEWKKDIPYDSKTLTIYNALESQKAAISNMKNGNIKTFKMGFRSRKNNTQILKVDYRALIMHENNVKKKKVKRIKLFDQSMWNGFSDINIKNKKDLKWLQKQFKVGPYYYKRTNKKLLKSQFIPSDFSIKYEAPNKYFLCIPSYRDGINKKASHELVSLDPGVRTFQTFYSPEGVVGKLGHNIVNKLANIGFRIDKLTSNADKEKDSRKKCKIQRRCSILRTKIKNTVNDLHWKTASYLCKNYERILLPEFNVREMVKVGKRKINNKSVRQVLSLSHYQFRQRLKCMASKYGRKVYICNEAYTSKTCGTCGFIDKTLEGKKLYVCEKCGVEIDRDISGARNILLRQLAELL